jgi:hypothetical protein
LRDPLLLGVDRWPQSERAFRDSVDYTAAISGVVSWMAATSGSTVSRDLRQRIRLGELGHRFAQADVTAGGWPGQLQHGLKLVCDAPKHLVIFACGSYSKTKGRRFTAICTFRWGCAKFSAQLPSNPKR